MSIIHSCICAIIGHTGPYDFSVASRTCGRCGAFLNHGLPVTKQTITMPPVKPPAPPVGPRGGSGVNDSQSQGRAHDIAQQLDIARQALSAANRHAKNQSSQIRILEAKCAEIECRLGQVVQERDAKHGLLVSAQAFLNQLSDDVSKAEADATQWMQKAQAAREEAKSLREAIGAALNALGHVEDDDALNCVDILEKAHRSPVG